MTDLNAEFDAIADDLPAVEDNVVVMPPEIVAENMERLARAIQLPHGAQTAWAAFSEALAASDEAAFYDIDALRIGVAMGRFTLWPGKNCGLLTEVFTFPSGAKAIKVVWGYGELTSLVSMAPGVEAAGRMNGCTLALVEGRSGWRKALKEAGYEPFSETLCKAL